MSLLLHTLDAGSRTVGATALPLDGPGSGCTAYMRAVPGAQWIHLLIESDNGGPSIRAEVNADRGDEVPVHITWDADGVLNVSSARKVLLLPAEDRYRPPRLLTPAQDGKLDLLFLFDATARIFNAQVNVQRKQPEEGPPEPRQLVTWQAHLDRVLEFAQHMRQKYTDVRVGCAAFGDLPMTDLAPVADLNCGYVFRHSEFSRRWLENISQQQLRDEFNGLEYTPGGDFVDALAEALESCQTAGWRVDARKLLVISGDSPGNAVIDPPPAGADARVRRVDLRQEALRLHEKYGVEILTIYLESSLSFNSAARRFVDYARLQYRSLATLWTLSWTADTFDPHVAAQEVQRAADGPGMAQGRGYGLLDRVGPMALLS